MTLAEARLAINKYQGGWRIVKGRGQYVGNVYTPSYTAWKKLHNGTQVHLRNTDLRFIVRCAGWMEFAG